MTQTKLWLLRHPEPEPDAVGRCYGTLDLDLSEVGLRQAHSLADALAGETLSAVYTSPSRRCTHAAQILAAGRATTLDALRELNFGELEGRTYDEIAEAYPKVYKTWMERPTEVQFPGGESFDDMCARVTSAARDLRARHAGASIALVTHGGVIRILLAEALGIPATNIFRIGQSHAAMNLVRYFGDSPVVELINGTAFSRR